MDVKCSEDLLEVALPLDAISVATRRKAIPHGHPSALHPWRALTGVNCALGVLLNHGRKA